MIILGYFFSSFPRSIFIVGSEALLISTYLNICFCREVENIPELAPNSPPKQIYSTTCVYLNN